jgi:hypothetical protein
MLPSLVAVLTVGAAEAVAAKPVGATTTVHRKVGSPVLVSCQGKWSYARERVRASVKEKGPASVRFTASESGGRSVSIDTTIPMGATAVSKTLKLSRAPTVVIATVVEENADGSPKGIDATCDLTRATPQIHATGS